MIPKWFLVMDYISAHIHFNTVEKTSIANTVSGQKKTNWFKLVWFFGAMDYQLSHKYTSCNLKLELVLLWKLYKIQFLYLFILIKIQINTIYLIVYHSEFFRQYMFTKLVSSMQSLVSSFLLNIPVPSSASSCTCDRLYCAAIGSRGCHILSLAFAYVVAAARTTLSTSLSSHSLSSPGLSMDII